MGIISAAEVNRVLIKLPLSAEPVHKLERDPVAEQVTSTTHHVWSMMARAGSPGSLKHQDHFCSTCSPFAPDG